MVDPHLMDSLSQRGYTIVPGVLAATEVAVLRDELERAIDEDLAARPDVFDKGMVHNCMVRGEHMAAVLDHPVLNAYVEAALADTCIIYAYQSSSLQPGQGNYGSRLHVDYPRFIPNYMTNLGVILPLDDFTLENGATYVLDGSQHLAELPDQRTFLERAKRAVCRAGDMIVFNGRLVHAAGTNQTDRTRHSLTINFCRSYMRQRFDFPRLVPPQVIARLGEKGRKLIGMNVRMPTSLDEFYLPVEQRLYKPNQG